jgi:uncharacterized protein YbjT (DUF2867 family)
MMILIIGASGKLGRALIRHYVAEGTAVRAMSRTPQTLVDLRAQGVEVVAGDLLDADSLMHACQGVAHVIAAAHAFDKNHGRYTPATVDGQGMHTLIQAARAQGVGHFVYTSIHGVRPDHPIDVFRYKYAGEETLRASGLSYTILRPTAFMDLWMQVEGDAIRQRNTALIFGRGTSPINFVAVDDVAYFAALACADARTRGQVLEIGGPQNLSFTQIADLFEQVMGHAIKRQRIPHAAMSIMGSLLRPIAPAVSRQMLSGALFDTRDQTLDPALTLTQFPHTLTPFKAIIEHWWVAQQQPTAQTTQTALSHR